MNPIHSELGGFFNDKIGSGLLDRRECQPKVRRKRLRPIPVKARRARAALAQFINPGRPLSVPAVEQQDFASVLQPHDGTKIIRRIRLKLDSPARAKAVLHEQPNLSRF